MLSTLVSEGNSQARWLKLTVQALTIPMIKRHIVSRRLLLNGKCGDNLSLRVVRALVNIRGTFFSDKNPPVNHNLAPSTRLLSCSMGAARTWALTCASCSAVNRRTGWPCGRSRKPSTPAALNGGSSRTKSGDPSHPAAPQHAAWIPQAPPQPRSAATIPGHHAPDGPTCGDPPRSMSS